MTTVIDEAGLADLADMPEVSEIFDAVTGQTPLLEIIGGRGASRPVRNDQTHEGAPSRRGQGIRYVLGERERAALSTFDGTAAMLNRLVDELGVPRNKLLDWLVELGQAKRMGQGKPAQLFAARQAPGKAAATALQRPAAEPQRPAQPIAIETVAAATPATTATIAQIAETPTPRIALDEWLVSGAEGIWQSGSIAVHMAETPDCFFVRIAHPDVPRVPGPVPGHLVEYLVRAMMRRSHVTGIVYR